MSETSLQTAKRARIFALLHEDGAARHTTGQIGPTGDRHIHPQIAQHLQQRACASLVRSNVVLRASKPGRDHKFF